MNHKTKIIFEKFIRDENVDGFNNFYNDYILSTGKIKEADIGNFISYSALNGSFKIIDFFVNKNPDSINYLNSYYKTTLTDLIEADDFEILKSFVDKYEQFIFKKNDRNLNLDLCRAVHNENYKILIYLAECIQKAIETNN
jgi:hypothetical protein